MKVKLKQMVIALEASRKKHEEQKKKQRELEGELKKKESEVKKLEGIMIEKRLRKRVPSD